MKNIVLRLMLFAFMLMVLAAKSVPVVEPLKKEVKQAGIMFIGTLIAIAVAVLIFLAVTAVFKLSKKVLFWQRNRHLKNKSRKKINLINQPDS